jgi:arylsulfatase A-like enzyme
MSKRFLDQRWPWLVAAAAIAITFLVTTFEFRSDTGVGRPVGSAEDIAALKERGDLNVLFILIDTLRADHLGAYGYERDTSPNLDRIAASGVRFERHLAQSSWTKASMASLWTSLYPTRTGITRFDHVIPEAAKLPAEILKEAGYRTAGIYRNGWVAPTFGFHQGFDVYSRPAPRGIPPQVRASNPTLKMRGTDEDAVAAALEFLRVHGHERWFLYLHLMDVHEYLYDDESALFGGAYGDIYDNSIRWTDGTVGLFWEHLAAGGYLENTVVAITSDHGEAFRERGLEGHARALYRESTEVPFLLSFPFRLPSGLVVEARTSNVDLWPTLFDVIGIDAPPDTDGRSLLPDVLASARGEAPAADRTAIAHLDQAWGQPQGEPQTAVAVAEGSFRYVRGENRGRRVEQLFDASKDHGELRDIALEDSDTLERLRVLADTNLALEPPWGESPRREVSELELNHLRALGYAIP